MADVPGKSPVDVGHALPPQGIYGGYIDLLVVRLLFISQPTSVGVPVRKSRSCVQSVSPRIVGFIVSNLVT